MSEIKLRGQKGLIALVDDCDFEMLSQHKWYAVTPAYVTYAYTNIGYGRKGYTTTYMHRLIMTPENRSQVVDHINHNGLDNRRENLRLCSHGSNLSKKNSMYSEETETGSMNIRQAQTKHGLAFYVNMKHAHVMRSFGTYYNFAMAERVVREAKDRMINNSLFVPPEQLCDFVLDQMRVEGLVNVTSPERRKVA